jgi:precorrin-8X/cobalt-precorrin-8 methylmutase
VRHGIIASTLPAKNRIICTLNDPAARERGVAAKTTRSAAAVSLWKDHLAGAVVAIGNAPTALLALLEGLDGGWPKPAAIAAFPVGFVGAAESKDALVAHPRGIPVATLLGRRGGSAMAAAAINALTRS